MGETIIFVGVVNAAMAAAFVLLVLAACKWTRIGSPSWFAWLAVLHAELTVSLAFNYHFLATGEALGLEPLQALQAVLWGMQ